MTTEAAQVYSVSQVAEYLKANLEADPNLSDLWIAAEISGLRVPASGHAYFTLKDENSALASVMFRGGRGGEFLDDGAQVVAHGRISMYTQRGSLQFYVDLVKPDGVGALQAAFEKLQKALAAEGLFDADRKRPLPPFPRKIAVVTSPSGAVLQDIINVLTRRYPLAELVVVPTAVQGENAAPLIADAIQRVNQAGDIGVAIIARGGGSLEDLWAFNEEIVARAIFASKVPIVSAVGHETDTTIADFVADVRAPTPSAAAEIVAPDRRELAASVRSAGNFMGDRLRTMLDDGRRNVAMAADRLAVNAPDTNAPRVRIDELLRIAGAAMNRVLAVNTERLRGAENALRVLGPAQMLERGYGIVRSMDSGAIISSVDGLNRGDALEITLTDGKIEAETRAAHRFAPDSPSESEAGMPTGNDPTD